MDRVTDIWFQWPGDLHRLAEAVGLQDVEYDVENYWEWVIGVLDGTRLDITRTHTRPPDEVETRIFPLGASGGAAEFGDRMLGLLVEKLQPLVHGSIHCGRWDHRSGDEFDVKIFRTYAGGARIDGGS